MTVTTTSQPWSSNPDSSFSHSLTLSPSYSALSISLVIISLLASISVDISSLFTFAHHPSYLNHSPTHGRSTLRLSLTRKLADPISTKLHCVSYLHAVASIYNIEGSKLHAALSFPFYLPMHSIFHLHMWHNSLSPHSLRGKKSSVSTVAFRVSVWMTTMVGNNRIKKKRKRKKSD